MASLGLADWQVAVGGVVMGPGTPYLIHNYEGLGLADVRSGDVARAADDGDFYGLDTRPSRNVTLTITVTGTSPEDARANLNTLMGAWWLRAGENTRDLNFKLPGMTELVLHGRPRRGAADHSRLLGRIVPVTLQFYTADPGLYSATTDSSSIGLPTATAGRSYPRVYPVSFGGSGESTTLTVSNDGNFIAKPVLTITGPCTNPKIVSDTQGKTLSFAITLAAGDQLVIDTDGRSVLLNGSASRRSALVAGSQWFTLDPGANQIRFLADAYQSAAQLTVAFSDTWVG